MSLPKNTPENPRLRQDDGAAIGGAIHTRFAWTPHRRMEQARETSITHQIGATGRSRIPI